MAMTKKETKEWQDKLDALREQLAEAQQWNAFRRTEPVKRDVKPPDSCSLFGYTYGWDYNAYNRTVSYCWSSSINHGTIKEGEEIHDKNKIHYSASQGRLWLYSTKTKALQALRHELELETAKRLAKIDQQIRLELQKEEQK